MCICVAMSEWNPNKPLDLGILDEFDTQPPEKKKKSLPLKLKKTLTFVVISASRVQRRV